MLCIASSLLKELKKIDDKALLVEVNQLVVVIMVVSRIIIRSSC